MPLYLEIGPQPAWGTTPPLLSSAVDPRAQKGAYHPHLANSVNWIRNDYVTQVQPTRHNPGTFIGTIGQSLEYKQAWHYWWPACTAQWEPVWDGEWSLNRGKWNKDGKRNLVTSFEYQDLTMFGALPTLDFLYLRSKVPILSFSQFELGFFACSQITNLLNTANRARHSAKHFVATNSLNPYNNPRT